MLKPEDAEYLAQLAKDAEAAHAGATEADDLRDEAIRIALESGGKPTEIGRLTGLTRARIYQIRDHRR